MRGTHGRARVPLERTGSGSGRRRPGSHCRAGSAADVSTDHNACTVQLVACIVQRVVPCTRPSVLRSPMSTPVAPPTGRPATGWPRCAPCPSSCRASCACVHALKTQLAKTDSRDRAALVLLFPLARLGPLRQGALAELVHADPSTVSRHVAALVEQGLVRRVADESDGRASRLSSPTPATPRSRRCAASGRATSHRSRPAGTPPTSPRSPRLFGRLLDDITATLPGVPTPPPPPTSRERSDEPVHPHHARPTGGTPARRPPRRTPAGPSPTARSSRSSPA